MKAKSKAVSTTTIATIISLGLVIAAAVAALPGGSPRPDATQSARRANPFDAGWHFQLARARRHGRGARQIVARRVREARQGAGDMAGAAASADISGADWRDANGRTTLFSRQAGFQWFRTVLPDVPGPQPGRAL